MSVRYDDPDPDPDFPYTIFATDGTIIDRATTWAAACEAYPHNVILRTA